MGTLPVLWYANTTTDGPPLLKYALAAASDTLPCDVNAMSVTVKSVGSTVAGLPAFASCWLAWAARKSWMAEVTVLTEATRGSVDVGLVSGISHGFPG